MSRPRRPLKQRIEALLGTSLNPCPWAFYGGLTDTVLWTPRHKTTGGCDYFAVVLVNADDKRFSVFFWWQPPGWSGLSDVRSKRIPASVRMSKPNHARLRDFWLALPDSLEKWHQEDMNETAARHPVSLL